MVSLKNEQEIALIGRAATILSEVHGLIARLVAPGITTRELDVVAENAIQQHGAMPSFKGYKGYTDTICASLNDVALHGKPNEVPLQVGDCLTIDIACCFQGYHADMAYTYLVGVPMNGAVVGGSQKESLDLLTITKEALNKGIEQAVVGNRLGDIGAAIQQHVTSKGFNVIKDYTGHGIGQNLHEAPNVFNFGVAGTGMKLKKGMVIAIEPIVTAGSGDVYEGIDGGVYTQDRTISAHYERTIAIGYPDVRTDFSYIENNLR